MKGLTRGQQRALDCVRGIARKNALYEKYKLKDDDESCAHSLGVLTIEVGSVTGKTCDSILGTFKTLEARGLLMREKGFPGYRRPLYWWPVGFAAELLKELADLEYAQ